MAYENDKEKLYVVITNEKPNNKSLVSGGNTGQEKQNTVGRYAEHHLFHQAKNLATQTVNYTLANIGNFTGDYITQRQVNIAKQQISNLMNIGMATAGGFATAGVVGGLVGFTIATSSIIASSVFQEHSNVVENQKINYSIGELRKRAGLNVSLDGSRGTEN